MSLVTVTGKAQQGLVLGDEGIQLSVPMDAIVSMHAISNTWLIGPTFDMLILDSSGTILNPMPTDGMKLRMTMGDSINAPNTYEFMCAGQPVVVPTARGQAVRISGILDVPKLFHSVCKGSIEGTSTEAISKLAKDCGLVEVDAEGNSRIDKSAGDNMKWLPMGRKYAYLLADIASHGWFGEESAASVCAVSLTKQIIYRDLAKLAKSEPKARFYHGVPTPSGDNNYMAHGSAREDHSTTGVGQLGYSVSRSRFNIEGVVDRLTNISVTQNNENLNIGKAIKEAVGLGRTMLAAPDCGNTHSNYEKAEYQNLRYRATYAQQIAVIVSRQTVGLDLYDPVEVYYLDVKTRETVKIHGVISAKIPAIVNGFYVERFNVAYQGEDIDIIKG